MSLRSKKTQNTGKSGKSKSGRSYKTKQVLAVGLVALVLAAGYYRWTLGAIGEDAASVSSTSTPVETDETFFFKDDKGGADDDENQEDNQEDNQEENKSESEANGTEDGTKSDSNSNTNVIITSRQDRDKLRGETMDKWKEISSNKDASESAKKEAEDNILKLTEYSENENVIETNVKAKGFEDCFAQVSDSGVSVVVKGGTTDSASIAQIKDIIISETGVSAAQIKISATE